MITSHTIGDLSRNEDVEHEIIRLRKENEEFKLILSGRGQQENEIENRDLRKAADRINEYGRQHHLRQSQNSMRDENLQANS